MQWTNATTYPQKILLIEILNTWVTQFTWCDVAAPHKIDYVLERDQA